MRRLTIKILGSAAGGGFPQWNCQCPVCRLAWQGDGRVQPRTQASLAVSADGVHWVLLNAAPDLREQIAATPSLHPQPVTGKVVRNSPIEAVVLTGAEVDQIAGLLNLRERQPFAIYATAATLDTIAANSIFNALASDVVKRETVALEKPFSIAGMEVELFAVPGKVPLYLEGENPHTSQENDSNVGIALQAGGANFVYVPGVAAITPKLMTRLKQTDLIMFDGTLFTDDEMIRTGSGSKTGRRMGHMPIHGSDGSLTTLAKLSTRRFYIHINNTNPILIEGSPERQHVEAAGVEIAEDGLEIIL